MTGTILDVMDLMLTQKNKLKSKNTQFLNFNHPFNLQNEKSKLFAQHEIFIFPDFTFSLILECNCLDHFIEVDLKYHQTLRNK